MERGKTEKRKVRGWTPDSPVSMTEVGREGSPQIIRARARNKALDCILVILKLTPLGQEQRWRRLSLLGEILVGAGETGETTQNLKSLISLTKIIIPIGGRSCRISEPISRAQLIPVVEGPHFPDSGVCSFLKKRNTEHGLSRTLCLTTRLQSRVTSCSGLPRIQGFPRM